MGLLDTYQASLQMNDNDEDNGDPKPASGICDLRHSQQSVADFSSLAAFYFTHNDCQYALTRVRVRLSLPAMLTAHAKSRKLVER